MTQANGAEGQPTPEQLAEQQALLSQLAQGLATTLGQHLPDLFNQLPNEAKHKLIERVLNETFSLEQFVASRTSDNPQVLPSFGMHFGQQGQPDAMLFGAKRDPDTLQEKVGTALVLAFATSPLARAYLHLRGVPFTFCFIPEQKSNLIV